jgi:hypothetical protein
MELAKAGKLAGVTIINRLELANKLADYVPHVIYRPVPDVSEFHEWGGDARLIYQFGNEENNPDDNAHWMQIMQAAGDRSVIIYCDSVGVTTDAMWRRRRESLLYAQAHGHFVGLHAYGWTLDGKDYHPMTDFNDPLASAWPWYAGRFEHLYSLMPDAQPPLILNECGAGGPQRGGGVDSWLKDVHTMQSWASRWPYLRSWHFWTTGGAGDYGFGVDTLDEWLTYLK